MVRSLEEEPRQVARGDAGQDRAGPPVAAATQQEEQHRQREQRRPPDRRRAEGRDRLRARSPRRSRPRPSSGPRRSTRPAGPAPASPTGWTGTGGTTPGRCGSSRPRGGSATGSHSASGTSGGPGLVARPVAAVRVVAADEPAGPRRRGRPRARPHHRGERGRGVADQRRRATGGARPPSAVRPCPTAPSAGRRPRRSRAPLHFVAQASPRQTPAGSRHGRTPSAGPEPARRRPRSSSVGRAGARRAVAVDEQAPNAASTQNISSRSSSAVRLCTKAMPVDREQQPGDAAEQRRAEQPAPDPATISTASVPAARR